MQFSEKSNVVENSAAAIALASQSLHEYDIVLQRTPLDELLDKEDREALGLVSDREEQDIRCEAVSGILGILFAPVNGCIPSPLDVLQRLYVLVYTLRPELIADWSLEKIAALFDSSRQVFSKKLIKQNEKYNIRSRNQKSSSAVSVYREGTTEWHAERKAAAAKEKRAAYMREYKKRNAAEDKAYQAQYRAQNRERLNKAKRLKRKTKQ